MTYRVYVADALRMITENTAPIAHGRYIRDRYFDIIRPKPEETRTSAEIIASIRAGLGGGQAESV